MKELFCFSRFKKYFVYDLNNAFRTYGLALLVIICLPLLLLILTTSISYIFTSTISFPEAFARIQVAILSFVFLCMSFGAVVYGKITKKKEGSRWILLPVSYFERTLSLLIISLIIVPIIYLLGYSFIDWVICSVFPQCGVPLFQTYSSFATPRDQIVFVLGGYPIAYLSVLPCILFYVLGAVVFYRMKVLFTFLFSQLLLVSGTISFGLLLCNINDIKYLTCINNAQNATIFANILIYILTLLPTVIIASLIALRIKTIKY